MSILKAIDFLTKELNAYLQSKAMSNAELAVKGNIAALHDITGSSSSDLTETVIVSLINIEEDRISKNPENIVRTQNGLVTKNPKIFLNLFILFAANRSVYAESLNALSLTIQFFQKHNYFDHTTPVEASGNILDDSIEKLVPDLVSLSFEQLNHLWAMLGGKYIPSVLYKMRMVSVDENITAKAEPITQILIDSQLKFQE